MQVSNCPKCGGSDISVTYERKPIPLPDFDWCVGCDNCAEYGGGSYGKSELDALISWEMHVYEQGEFTEDEMVSVNLIGYAAHFEQVKEDIAYRVMGNMSIGKLAAYR